MASVCSGIINTFSNSTLLKSYMWVIWVHFAIYNFLLVNPTSHGISDSVAPTNILRVIFLIVDRNFVIYVIIDSFKHSEL